MGLWDALIFILFLVLVWIGDWYIRRQLIADRDRWRRQAEGIGRELQRKSYDAFHYFRALQLACFYKHDGSVAHNVNPSQRKIDRSVKGYLAETGYDPTKWEPKAAAATKEADDEPS